MQYDLVVIGGGPAGYAGAIRAAKLGMKTALIEREHLGGTCLNRGCIPTKALLHSAEIFSSRGEWAENGISATAVSFDEQSVYSRKQKIVEALRGGIASLVKAGGIDLYTAHGEICGVNTVRAGDALLTTKHILIATGSEPSGFDPDRPLEGIGETLSSDDVLNRPVEGGSVIIVGGGVIAVEFASYFAMAGKSVTLLVSGERILRAMSRDISLQLSSILKRLGVKIITSAIIKRLGRSFAEIEGAEGVERLDADAVVAAVGRTANLKGIGLESIGLKVGKSIKVDGNMYTGVGGVYACGDVIGSVQLAHYATASAITAVESMLGVKHSVDLSVCPSCIYTKPEIAVVGETDGAKEGVRTGKFLMGGNGKSMIEGVKNGYVKVFADKDDKIIGAELFCVRATDMVGELALAVSQRLSVSQAAAVIHPHPTVMEAVGEALEDIHGLATHIMPRK